MAGVKPLLKVIKVAGEEDLLNEEPAVVNVDPIAEHEEDDEDIGDEAPLLHEEQQQPVTDPQATYVPYKIGSTKDLERIKRMAVKWTVIFSCSVVVWLGLLATGIYMQIAHDEKCSPTNLFGEFSIAICGYLLIQYALKTFITASALHKTKELINSDTLGDIADFKEELDDKLTEYTVGDYMNRPQASKEMVAEMVRAGEEKLMHEYREAAVNLAFNDREGDDVINIYEQDLHKVHPMKQNKSKKQARKVFYDFIQNPYAVGGRIMAEMAVHLFTIICYLILGVNSISQDRAWVKERGLDTPPTICVLSAAYNWSVLAISLLQSVVPLIPFLRSVAKAN